MDGRMQWKLMFREWERKRGRTLGFPSLCCRQQSCLHSHSHSHLHYTYTYSRVFISIVMLNNNCVSTHTSSLHLQTIKCCVVFRFVTTERRPIEFVTKPTLPSHTTRHKLKRSSSKTCFICPAIPRMFLLAALFIPCPVPILEKCLTKVTPVI